VSDVQASKIGVWGERGGSSYPSHARVPPKEITSFFNVKIVDDSNVIWNSPGCVLLYN